MNHGAKEKPTIPPPPNPKEKLGSGLKPEEETKPKEPKEPKEPLRKVSPDDKSLHVNLTEEEITSVKVFHDRLVRIERMLEWLVVQRVTDAQKLIKQPNITDILKEIMSKMADEKPKEKKEGTEEEKEDEVQTPT